MSSNLHHGCARVPVTAVKFHDTYVLAAEGPFLRVFDGHHDSRLLAFEKIFQTQAIHGFEEFASSSILAYGGSFMRVIKLNRKSHGVSLEMGPVTHVSDWILSVSNFQLSNCDGTFSWQAVAVTAHNALILLRTDPPLLKSSVHESYDHSLALHAQHLTPSSRCILYSAHIVWLNSKTEGLSHDVLIASGTAFGEILVWSCSVSAPSKPTTYIHHFFTGHEGSIFGVQILESPRLSDEKDARRLLASCSDDRTIRLWDISTLPIKKDLTTTEDPLNLLQDRETGFGANITDQDKCLAVAWAHTSRVWAMRTVYLWGNPGSRSDVVHLISFGEDATSRIWQINCSRSEAGKILTKLNLLGTKAFHSGKNIWSIDVSRRDSSGNFDVVTGAADSAIISYQWPSTSLEYASPQPSKDAHRCYALISDRSFLSATNSGQVVRGDFDGNDIVWHILGQLDDLKGYSVAASIPRLGVVFLAGGSGKVHCYNSDSGTLSSVAQVKRKITGLFATLTKDEIGSTLISLTVTQVGAVAAEHFLISPEPQMPVVQSTTLELPPKFIVTSALYVATQDQRMIFLGARNGSVAAFKGLHHENVQASTKHTSTAIYTLHKPETVTSLSWVAAQPAADASLPLGQLISVGRDGRCTSTQVYAKKPALLVHRSSLPFGPNAEGMFIDEATGNLMVYGFRGKQFVLFDTSTEQEVFAVECGGCHRIWAFCPTATGGTFAWQQAGTMKLYSTTEVSHRVIRRGGHGREIKALAASSADLRIIATGAEDTTIRIFEYPSLWDGQSDFRCVRVTRKHVTGIQELQWSDDGRFLFSSAANEEFFVWRIRKVPVIGIGVVCEAECPPESELPDLRIMNFAVRQKGASGETNEEEDAGFMITMVYSDSTVRTYSYTSTATTKHFQLLHTGNYLTSCLTQCECLSPSHLLTAGTDGHLAFWQLPNTDAAAVAATTDPATMTVTARTKIHQSTIKTLAWQRLAPDTVLLLTGGDDNALGLTLIRTPSDNVATPTTATLLVPRAHAATITSCVLLPCRQSHIAPESGAVPYTFFAVTSGNDQRVRVWEVTVNLGKPGVEGVEVKRVANVPTSVADVSGMAYLGNAEGGAGEGCVVVAGVGMDAWRLDLGIEGE